MDVRLERFTEAFYPEISKWWSKHNHPVLPFNMLSPFGLIAHTDAGPSCVSFVYLIADCDIAQISWTTTNPDVALRKRYEAVDYCIKGLLGAARHYGKTNVLCFSDSKGLTKLINKNGLKVLHNHSLLYGSLGVF